MAESRTARFRGRTRPDRPEWTVSTVARRTTNQNVTETCAVTGADVPLDEPHFLVTGRVSSERPFRDYEYDEIVVADGALGELDQWLEDNKE